MLYQVIVSTKHILGGVEVFVYSLVPSMKGPTQISSQTVKCAFGELPETIGNLTKDLFTEILRAGSSTTWTQEEDYNREADERYGPAK